jgi:ABC-type phosphate transport system substrate-binding protein
MRVVLAVLIELAIFAELSATSRAAVEEPLLVIVHPSVPVTTLSAYQLEAIFTREQTHWSNGSTIIPFSFPANGEVRELFDRTVLRLDPEEVGRFWLDHRIRGLGLPPKQVPSAALMLKVVANLPGSIGYIPILRARPGVKVVARIAQGKVLSP